MWDENDAKNTYNKTVVQDWIDPENGNNGKTRTYLTDATNAALTEEEEKDLENDPLCFMGVAHETDLYGPQATCCRGYELDDRQGKYMDFCLQPSQEEPDKLVAHDYLLQDMWNRHTWNKEISSMWCGDDAMAICKAADNIKHYTIGGEIQDTLDDMNNMYEHCRIEPYDGHGAILYEDPMCKGKNYPIRLEDKKYTTECNYDTLAFLWDASGPHKWKVGSIKSVRLNWGTEMEMFKDESHVGHSYTLKNFELKFNCFEGTDWWWNAPPVSGDDYRARSLQYRII